MGTVGVGDSYGCGDYGWWLWVVVMGGSGGDGKPFHYLGLPSDYFQQPLLPSINRSPSQSVHEARHAHTYIHILYLQLYSTYTHAHTHTSGARIGRGVVTVQC